MPSLVTSGLGPIYPPIWSLGRKAEALQLSSSRLSQRLTLLHWLFSIMLVESAVLLIASH